MEKGSTKRNCWGDGHRPLQASDTEGRQASLLGHREKALNELSVFHWERFSRRRHICL